MVFSTGAISYWFQANWTSVTDGGTGPTNWAALFSVGNWTSNAAHSAWTLAISPEGTNLLMDVQAGGSNQIVFDVPIDFDAGDWHSLTLTYSATNFCLYLEGQLVTNAEPAAFVPSYEDCTNYGMFVGSLSTAGTGQSHGQFQWLATYDYPLSAGTIASDYAAVSSYITYFGGNLAPVGISPGGGGFADDSGPPSPGGGSTNSGGEEAFVTLAVFTPPAPISATDYSAYNDFYLVISNSTTSAYVTVSNTLSNLTYEVETNSNLSQTNGWGVWQTFRATNSFKALPALSLSSSGLNFRGVLVYSTCTNYSPALPDWWAMLYFDSTACVNPTANPTDDGIDNWDKYVLGLNPNVTYVSQLVVNPPGGDYVSMPSISIFSLTGASIKYTTNGSIPSATNGFTASSGVPLTNVPSGSFTLKAWESGIISNVPAVATYAVVPATPVLSLAESVYGVGTGLQISCVTSNATVRYTTNGVDPTTNSTQIQATNVIMLTTNVTVKAIAWLGTNASPEAGSAFIIMGPPVNDNFSNVTVLAGSSGQFTGTTVAA